jgi:hypothetical protein
MRNPARPHFEFVYADRSERAAPFGHLNPFESLNRLPAGALNDGLPGSIDAANKMRNMFGSYLITSREKPRTTTSIIGDYVQPQRHQNMRLCPASNCRVQATENVSIFSTFLPDTNLISLQLM